MVAGYSSTEDTYRAIMRVVRQGGRPRLIGFTKIDTLNDVLYLIEGGRHEWDDVKSYGHTSAR